MTPLEDRAALAPAGQTRCGLVLQLQDTLASATRLWVRGRVLIPTAPSAAAPGWWARLRQPLPSAEPGPSRLTLHTRFGGENHEQDVPVRPDGRFEAAFAVAPPASSRGWRVA